MAVKGRYEDIMDFLITEGYSVYAAGAHKGQIINPYIVVKPGMAQRYMNYSSVIQYYDILVYGRTITESVRIMNEINEKMKKMRPMIVCTFNSTEPFYDDDIRGYMVSAEYRNMKKIEY